MKAKKSLGQNFLVNESIIDNIIELIDCNKDDLIIEIGPGRGALSKKLVKNDCQYVAIEIDKDMESYLNQFNINVIYDDILNVDLNSLLKKYKYNRLFIVGNLPYYITSPILEKLVLLNVDIYKMIFMVQKEVGLRYSANPGSKDYGYMSLFLQYRYDVKKEFDVKRGNFNPIPNVDSCIISLTNNNKTSDIDFIEYTKFLKTAFSMKRKTLKNNLKEYNWEIINSVLKMYNYLETVRAEELSQEVFIKIFSELKK